VSIITPTWQRHALLRETIDDVRRQTYRPLEHVVVSDGTDETLRHALLGANGPPPPKLRPGEMMYRWQPWPHPPVRFVELGRNWSTFLPRSFGIAPLSVGALLARGEYQMWLCDDERMQPDHVEHLVELIERTGADFVYPQVLMWKPSHPGVAWTIGADPPKHGQITNFLYRASALRKAMYRFDIPVEGDWDLVSRWMEAGASWAMSDRCTISHRADH
jgi:GT2 family glycosyltransferase